MFRTITASSQFKIYAAVALAALLMTLLAVTLAAGPAQATATTTFADSGDDNSIPQQRGTTSRDATPEPCPGEPGNPYPTPAAVVDSGYYALFDVWWNPVEKELTNTVCPPKVEFVRDRGGSTTTNRSPSSINIEAEPPTIIHIPSSAKINLSDSVTPGGTTYKAMYPQVLNADNKEDRPNAEGTPVPGKGDGIVWALPACPDSPTTGGLCLSFSAGLLKTTDWNGNIDYLVHHVHQVDIDRQDPRYVLVYDVPASGATQAGLPLWDSSDARKSTVSVAPGGYNRPLWFFTDRGTYEFQVNIQGNPDTTISNPESKDDSVSSDVREYIVHVGAEADLGVAMTVAPQSPSPGNSVTITITASNTAGKDEAQETKVDVSLPEGLTYSSHEAPTGTTYNSTTGDWTWNEGISLASGASATLTITATVDRETHGKTLTAKATISATEPVQITETVNGVETVVTYHVAVPDPNPDNNMATGAVTVTSSAIVAPMFMVARSVPESSAAGTNVGAPVSVKNPDGSDLTFTLTGNGHENFTVEAVEGGAQIKVAANSYLNYEDTASPNNYDLTLQVSDGKDSNGNDDDSVDDTILVRIAVTDVSESVGLTVTATPATQRVNIDVEASSFVGEQPARA